MSAKKQAFQLQQYGRHGDDMLMHVSRDEVASLQKIAQAHGKTLSINPETGLPEAFSFGDFAKIAALAAATYATGGALAPALTGTLGATAGGVVANAAAGAAVSKLANPELSGKQLAQNALGGALVGGALNGLGGTIGQYGAEAAVPTGAEAAVTPATEQAVSQGTANGLGTGMYQSAPPTGSTLGSGAYGVDSSPVYAGGSDTSAAAGFERGMQDPGKFADHVLTTGKGDIAKGVVGAGMMTLDSPEAMKAKDPIHGSYTIHDIYGNPIVDRAGSAEDSFSQARTVNFADGGNVGMYASGGRVVDPFGTAPAGIDTVPAMIDNKQPAKLNSGEYVMTTKAVQNAGGPKAMDKIHAKLKSGKGIGKMARV